MLVKHGIESMRNTKYEGIRCLLEVSGIHVEQVTAVNVAFSMAPRINASGRLDHAGRAVTPLQQNTGKKRSGLPGNWMG